MRTRLLQHLRSQFVGYIALVITIGGGTAYAANTIGSADIIDESILSQDIKNAQVKTSEIAAGAVNTDKIANDQVLSGDVRDDTLANGGLSAADLRAGSVGPSEANGLTGADIQNGTLGAGDLAPTTRQVVGPESSSCAGDPGTFCSGWVNSDHPAEGTSFFKDLSGIVHIQGMIRCTCAATNEIFYLPAGYRPSGQLGFAVDVSGFEHGRVDVLSNGLVKYVAGPVTGHLSLSGISFSPRPSRLRQRVFPLDSADAGGGTRSPDTRIIIVRRRLRGAFGCSMECLLINSFWRFWEGVSLGYFWTLC